VTCLCVSMERAKDLLKDAEDFAGAADDLFTTGRWTKVCFNSHQEGRDGPESRLEFFGARCERSRSYIPTQECDSYELLGRYSMSASRMLPRERLKSEADQLIAAFLEETRPLRPKAVLLYGSYAKGNFTEGSDIDICLIAENLPDDELARRVLIGLYRTPRIRALGFRPLEFLDFLDSLRFLTYDIVADGVVLFDDGFYRKIRETFETCVAKFRLRRETYGWRIIR